MADTLAEAKRLKSQLETDKARGALVGTTLTVEAYCDEWLKHYQGRSQAGLALSSSGVYERHIRLHIDPLVGKLKLSALDTRDCRAFIKALTERVSYVYAQQILVTLKLILTTAVEDGLIERNPAQTLRITKAPTTRIVDPSLTLREAPKKYKALSLPELERILAASGGYRLMFQFLYETGLRVGELIGVQYQDLDLEAGWLHVRRQYSKAHWTLPKGGKTRRIPLSEGLISLLRDLTDYSSPTQRLFPYSENSVSRFLKPIREAAGLEWVTAHTFRHTCATHLFKAEFNAVQVQLWLGHHDPGFTLRTYVHLFPEDLDGSVFDRLRGT